MKETNITSLRSRIREMDSIDLEEFIEEVDGIVYKTPLDFEMLDYAKKQWRDINGVKYPQKKWWRIVIEYWNFISIIQNKHPYFILVWVLFLFCCLIVLCFTVSKILF